VFGFRAGLISYIFFLLNAPHISKHVDYSVPDISSFHVVSAIERLKSNWLS